MRRFRTILLDDGGVMNDNRLRGPEWQRLVGEYLAPRLGGSEAEWAEANDAVFSQMWREFEELVRPVQEADTLTYFDFFGDERARWLRDMCIRVGIEPPGENDCYAIGLAAEDYVLPRVRSGFPGAAETIRVFDDRGYELGTVSGQTARELEGYLAGLGVRELFPERLYGPDLVRAMKGTSAYYKRIFEAESLDPAETLIVDDSPLAVARAAGAGAATVLVAAARARDDKADWTITRLAELPDLLTD